ncbi:MAG TPA: ATPase domain-containing protein [Methylomirabilota bacterium]|nr:ATPase domain-containing protein [Methylomirabilota bacterium]
MKRRPSTSPQIDRSSTGILGLDDILLGGLPTGNLYVVQGEPGVGKTTLALHFLLAGTRIGERGLYVSFSETEKELMSVAASHNWNLNNITILDLSSIQKAIKAEDGRKPPEGGDGTRRYLRALLAEAKKARVNRLVIDGVAEFSVGAPDPFEYRNQLMQLKEGFGSGTTTLVLRDNTMPSQHTHLESVAHGMIGLEKSESGFGAEQRRLRIIKLRGSQFRAGFHNFVIEEGGLQVFPRLIAAEHVATFTRTPLSSGIPELDALLGGGLDKGTSTLFTGPSGTGKSTMAIYFAAQAAKRGDKVVIYSFEESIGLTVHRCRSLGMDLTNDLENSTIVLRQINPGELSPGQFAFDIKNSVLTNGVSFVVIDSLNGYLNAMPDERFLLIQLHELLMFLAQQGVITILTVAQPGGVLPRVPDVDVSYLADAVVLLRYFEALGSVRTAISAVKKRSSDHEHTIREFSITSRGLQVGDVIKEFQGVLTGTPTYTGTTSPPLLQPKTPKKKRR